jgi:BT1 family
MLEELEILVPTGPILVEAFVDPTIPKRDIVDSGSAGGDGDDGVKKEEREDNGIDFKSVPSSYAVANYLNPFNLFNGAISMSYFEVGIAMTFISTPVTYYLIDTLDVSATQYSAFATLTSLPWSLKFLFGMLSDGVPIINYRRKSWLLFGWLVYIGINFYLWLTNAPSFLLMTSMMFFMTVAYLLSDVCSDTLCVERSRFEFEPIKGSFQTSAYTIRAYGCLLGSILGAVLYNTPTWGWGLTINQVK